MRTSMPTNDDSRVADDTLPLGARDVRQRVSTRLWRRHELIAADAVSTLPFAQPTTLSAEYCGRIAQMVVRILASAVRDGVVDARGGAVAQLRIGVLERGLPTGQLFDLVCLCERAALDDLSAADEIATAGDPWTAVMQLVHRASFHLLAAFVERTQIDIGTAPFTDTLTTLHTWPIFEAVLIKECERAGRFGLPLALILFDVDRLTTINESHGYGVGDRILERLGILIRKYFRQHDWVARHSDDSIAVLLTNADADHAGQLAERVRSTVEERLGFADHRSDELVPVTVTAAVITVPGIGGGVVDPERLLVEAETTMKRAKEQGRNRVENASGLSAIRTLPRSSPSV